MKKLFVAFAAVMMVAAFATTTIAGDWNFYGSARVSWWYIDREQGTGATKDSNTNSRFQLQNNSRLGARVKGGKVYGRFELGINPDTQNSNPAYTGANAQANGAGSGVYTRLLFGSWNFGAGNLVVGKDYTPEYLGVSSANLSRGSDSVMIGNGVPYGGRRAQVRLEFGGFEVALISPTGITPLNTAGRTETMFPKIAARYGFKFDPVSFDIAGSYQSYDLMQTNLPEQSVDSWYVGVRATAKLGPLDLKGVIYGAQNGSNMALSGAGSATTVNTGLVNQKIIDNDAMGWCVTGTYTLNDMIQFQAGYGQVDTEMDDSNASNATAPAGTTSGAVTKDKRATYYLQSTITLAPGVFIVPEIGRDDGKKNAAGNEDPDDTWFGAKFQIDF